MRIPRENKGDPTFKNLSAQPSVYRDADVVRIYVSSAVSDTECERGALLDQAYPRIKKHCHDQGYDFQLVDLAMGLSPWATNDHMFEEVCLQELLLCRTESTGPNFVSLSGQKYGPQSLPRVIGEKEFNKMLSCLEKEEHMMILKRWYQLDGKAIPPCYVLRPINLNIPNYLSIFDDQREKSEKEWKKEREKVLYMLYKAAEMSLCESEAKRLLTTGTESETEMGILRVSEPSKTCRWYYRQFTDVDKSEDTNTQLMVYTERGRQTFQERNTDLHTRMKRALEQRNISKHFIKWTEKGVDIENPDHLQYLKSMCSDFEQNMISMIDQAIKYKQELPKTISTSEEEIHRHLQTCQDNCQNIVGQDALIKKIKDYIFSDNKNILAIGGSAGAGKTSVMAVAIKQASVWLGNDDVLISRFVGSTKQSSTLPSLLKSIVNQFRKISGSSTMTSNDIKKIRRSFKDIFTLDYMKNEGLENRKFVVFIDSVERLDPRFDSHIISTWLPKEVLSEVGYTCKLIISYQDEDEADVIFHIKEIISKENLLFVSKLNNEDVQKIIEQHSKNEKREISPNQKIKILQAFQKNPSPLYLKLTLRAAIGQFKLEYKIDEYIQRSLNDAIEHLFRELEMKYGKEFVERALGYITAAKCGLSEYELEDILSCDDYVIDHVYPNLKCSTRRFPVLMIVRLRNDLSQYIGKYTDNGKKILFWTHRKFENVAKARYLNEKSKKTIHKGLAEFFSGKWSGDNAKPYVGKNGEQKAVRHVVPQPIAVGIRINERKLKCLPFHQTTAELLQELKSDCLLNLNFMFHKMKCASVNDLLDDLTFAIKTFPKKDCFKVLHAALVQSSRALQRDPRQLPGQLLDRLNGKEVLSELRQQCKDFIFPYIISIPFLLNKEIDACKTFDGHSEGYVDLCPGQNTIFCFNDYYVNRIALLSNPGEPLIAITVSDGDKSIRMTNLENGRLLMVKSLEPYGVLRPLLKVTNFGFVVHCSNNVLVIEESEHVIPVREDAHVETCGKQNDTVVIFDKENVTLLDSKSGVVKNQIPNSFPKVHVSFDINQSGCLSYGSENFIAVTSFDRTTLGYFSLAKQQFSEFIQPPVTGQDLHHIAISTDESLILLFMEHKDLAMYDLKSLVHTKTLTVFPTYNCLTHTQLYVKEESIYFATLEHLHVYDFANGELTTRPISKNDVVKDLKSLDLKNFVTITSNGFIKMTAINENVPQRETKIKYRYVLPMTNTRYLLLIWRDKKAYNWLLEIYDIKEQEVVRRCNYSKGYIQDSKLLDDKSLIIERGRKIKVLDLDTMTIKTVFQGFTTDSDVKVTVICHKRQEIITQTRAGWGIKSYDVTSGKTKWLLPLMKDDIISDIMISESEDVICCFNDRNRVLICDSVKKELIGIVKRKDVDMRRLEEIKNISSSGRYLVISAAKGKPITDCQVIWDTQNKTAVYSIRGRSEEDVPPSYTSESVIIGDEFFIEGKNDGVIAVWDLKTGQHITNLIGYDDKEVKLHYVSGGPYFVSETRSVTDVILMIWNIKTWDCVASFRTEPDILDDIRLLSDGRSLVGNSNGNIVHLTLCRASYQDNIFNEPKIFETSNLTTCLSNPTDKNEDPDDPDKKEVEDNDDDNGDERVPCPFCNDSDDDSDSNEDDNVEDNDEDDDIEDGDDGEGDGDDDDNGEDEDVDGDDDGDDD